MKVKLGAKVEYWDRVAGQYVVRQRIFYLTNRGRPIRTFMLETRTPAPKGIMVKVDKRELEEASERARKIHEKKIKEVMDKRHST